MLQPLPPPRLLTAFTFNEGQIQCGVAGKDDPTQDSEDRPEQRQDPRESHRASEL